MGIRDFLTFKTSRQLARERINANEARLAGEDAFGIEAVFEKPQQEVDKLRLKVQGFLTDVTKHFDKAGIAQYLKSNFKPTTQFENIEMGVRRMGIRWVFGDIESGLDFKIAFAIVEKQGEVRVDYLGEVEPHLFMETGPHARKVTNDKFTQYNQDEFRKQEMYNDKLQSMRRFETYQDFQDSKFGPPEWFVHMLKTHIPSL